MSSLNKPLSQRELDNLINEASKIDSREKAFGFITNKVNRNPGKEERRTALRRYLLSLINELDDFEAAFNFIWARNHKWKERANWLLINNPDSCSMIEDQALDAIYKTKLKELYFEAFDTENSVVRLNHLIEVGPTDILSLPIFKRVCVKNIKAAKNIDELDEIIVGLGSCKLKWFNIQDNNADNNPEALTVVECPSYSAHRPAKIIFCDDERIADALSNKIDDFFYTAVASCASKEEIVSTAIRHPEVRFYKNGIYKRVMSVQNMFTETT